MVVIVVVVVDVVVVVIAVVVVVVIVVDVVDVVVSPRYDFEANAAILPPEQQWLMKTQLNDDEFLSKEGNNLIFNLRLDLLLVCCDLDSSFYFEAK